jgi:ABC-type antimicrobial peptide transport system permease subunit
MRKRILEDCLAAFFIILAAGVLGCLAGFLVVTLNNLIISDLSPQQTKFSIIGFIATGIVMGLMVAFKYMTNRVNDIRK